MERELLGVVSGARQGATDGTKIRLPHALVMTFLFQPGSLKQKLESIPGIDLAIKHTAKRYHVPTLVIDLRTNESGRDPNKILQDLVDGEPRVFITYDANEDAISVNPINLQPGEGPLLASRLLEVLA